MGHVTRRFSTSVVQWKYSSKQDTNTFKSTPFNVGKENCECMESFRKVCEPSSKRFAVNCCEGIISKFTNNIFGLHKYVRLKISDEENWRKVKEPVKNCNWVDGAMAVVALYITAIIVPTAYSIYIVWQLYHTKKEEKKEDGENKDEEMIEHVWYMYWLYQVS